MGGILWTSIHDHRWDWYWGVRSQRQSDDVCTTCYLLVLKSIDSYIYQIRSRSVFAFICILLILGTTLEIYQYYQSLQGTKCSNGLLQKFLLGFGVYGNTCKLVNTDTSNIKGHLGCIDGIRFLSMSWVVLCHCWGEFAAIPMQDVALNMLTVIHISALFTL